MMDNFGYGELGAYGGGEIRGAATPKMDSIARDGMKLELDNYRAKQHTLDEFR